MNRVACRALIAVFFATGSLAAMEASAEDISLSTDFRFRYENDWDSIKADGAPRDDRGRLRLRLRASVAYKPNDWLDFAIRARSGNGKSQQSPHVTIADFDGNRRGDADAVLDKYFVRVRCEGMTIWGGRNGFPFFKQNELFWDDDVTVLGGAASYPVELGGAGTIKFTGGGFILPAGMWDYTGRLFAGQALYETKLDAASVKAAAGLFAIDADRDDPDNAILLQGNGARDYTVLAVNLQSKWTVAGRPLTLGGDVFLNLEDYDDNPDPFTRANADETEGFAASAFYGDLKDSGHWLAGYSYARIEQFAVDNSFAQDDWVRFGSATQTRASNIKGHEVRLGYAVTPKINLLARLYLVEAITTVEDGNRFRLDLNVKF